MNQRRVVVTGMGMVSPLGNDLESSWDSIVNGRSGLGPITLFDASAFSTRIAGEIRGFDPTAFIAAKDVKKMDAFIHYGIAASLMAMEDSGLEVTEQNAERIGAIIGAGIGGILCRSRAKTLKAAREVASKIKGRAGFPYPPDTVETGAQDSQTVDTKGDLGREEQRVDFFIGGIEPAIKRQFKVT